MNMSLEQLLDALPDHIKADGEKYNLLLVKGTVSFNTWIVGYANYSEPLLPLGRGKTLHEALTQLWSLLNTHPDFAEVLCTYEARKCESKFLTEETENPQ